MNKLAIYEKVRPMIQPGDVISFKGSGFISWLILRIDKRSHVASVSSGSTNPLVAERKLIIEADEGEVNTRALSVKLSEYNGEAYWHRLKPELQMYRNAIDAFLWEHIGVHYDYGSLFANALGRVSTNADRWFCSEYCGASVKETIPEDVLKRYLPEDSKGFLRMLLAGTALRPGGVARLPIWQPEVRLI